MTAHDDFRNRDTDPKVSNSLIKLPHYLSIQCKVKQTSIDTPALPTANSLGVTLFDLVFEMLAFTRSPAITTT
jgi:hypothetical protein